MKTARNSMFVSGLSLVLSVAILMGATFAWFTDSVTNSGNTIQAGELEVGFRYKDLVAADATYADVPTAAGEMGKLFVTENWEPGRSQGLDLKVVNNGTLALKWQMYFTNVESTGGQNNVKLADVLDVYVIDVDAADLSGAAPVGTLSGLAGGLVHSGTLTAEAGSTETEFSVVLRMREDAGNDYQNAKVTFDVELRATQAASEADGFGNTQYDAAANGNPDQDWSNGGSAASTAVSGQPTVLSVPGVKLVVPANTVPAGTKLTLDVTPIEPPSGVPVGDGQSAISYDITVTGLPDGNQTPIPVEMYIGKGLTNVTLYHGTEPIESDYNPDTGYITFKSTSFSPFTVVYSLFQGGTGADEDAYLIGTAAQLKAFRDSVNAGNSYQGKTIELTASIDLGGAEWEPIGTGTSFQGVFDGGGNTVSNYKVTKTAENAGLFGTMVSPGVIRNVTVADVTVSATSSAGALIGSSFTGNLEGCRVTGAIQITANYKAGGLSGGGYARITDCHVEAASGSSVTGVYQAADLEGDNVGGLIGFVGEGGITITDSSVSGLTVAGTRKVGGLAGSVFTNNVISGCTVKEVTVSSNATAEYVAGNGSSIGIGGVVGVYTANGAGNGSLKNCTAQDITLSGLTGVHKGYLVGGMRSDLPNFPAAPWTQSGNQLSGTNTGSNSSVDGTVTGGAYPATVVATEVRSIADFGEAYENTSTGQTLTEYLCRGGSFKLMNDITIDKTVYFYADTVIDLNGHTITKDFGGNLCALVETGAITFKNGSVKIAESAIQGVTNYGDFWYQRHFYDYNQVINLNFEDVTINVPEKDGFAAFKGYPRSNTGSQTVNITGAAIIGGAVEDFDNAVIQNYTNCTHNGNPYPSA